MPNARQSSRQLALGALASGLLLVLYAAFVLIREVRTQRTIDRVLSWATPGGALTAEGTNELVAVSKYAVPVLLRWSAGQAPDWLPLANKALTLLRQPRLAQDIWKDKEKARVVFSALRTHATPAVPVLAERLSDTNLLTRRFAVQMLGAIGAGMGDDVFRRLTNCLSDADQDVRNELVWTLQFHCSAQYPANRLIPVFRAGLTDTDAIIRQNAMIGFLRLGTNATPAREAIEAALKDSDAGVRSLSQRWVAKDYIDDPERR
jgi:hypothetical protein